jgi:hypothetical protein
MLQPIHAVFPLLATSFITSVVRARTSSIWEGLRSTGWCGRVARQTSGRRRRGKGFSRLLIPSTDYYHIIPLTHLSPSPRTRIPCVYMYIRVRAITRGLLSTYIYIYIYIYIPCINGVPADCVGVDDNARATADSSRAICIRTCVCACIFLLHRRRIICLNPSAGTDGRIAGD